MPKYVKNKRRRRHNLFSFDMKPETIPMESTGEKKPKKQNKPKQSAFRILNGKKQVNKIKHIVLASIALILVIVAVVIFISAPTGLGDMFVNSTAAFSLNSNLPIKLNSSETYNCILNNNHLFLVSDSDVSCYYKNGNLSFSDAHGFTYPVLCESDTRCLVYDQNGDGIHIYNAKNKILSKKSEYPILAADIGRNGCFAFASKSEKYTSMITVCDKNGNMIFEWFCPEETINSVAVSPKGNSVAVTTLFVNNGVFNSKLYILKFDSADPVFTKEYKGEIIYGINSVNNKNFVVIGEKFCDIVSWKKNEITTFSTDYSVDGVKANDSYIFISTSRENNDGNTVFTVYNNNRKLKYNYNFEGTVDDFVVKGRNVYALSRNNIFMINRKGEVKKQANCGFGVVKIVALSSGSSLAVGHNDVKKVSLK